MLYINRIDFTVVKSTWATKSFICVPLRWCLGQHRCVLMDHIVIGQRMGIVSVVVLICIIHQSHLYLLIAGEMEQHTFSM